MAEVKTGWLKDYDGNKFAPITDASKVLYNNNGNENVQDVLSKKPGRLVEGETFTIDEAEYIAENGAEIFNDLTNNVAVGLYSHAEGTETVARGRMCHAEGAGTVANGVGAHAEGFGSIANGWGSHAEGVQSKSLDFYSHAEGSGTIAEGSSSHAEGQYTIASGYSSHAEGCNTVQDIYITGNNLSYVQEQKNQKSPFKFLDNVILTNEGVISKSDIESQGGVLTVSGGKTYFIPISPFNEIKSSYSIALYSNYINEEISGFIASYPRETSSITIPNDFDTYYLVMIDKSIGFSFLLGKDEFFPILESYELITNDQKNKYIINPNDKDGSTPYILISESNAHELILKQTLGECNRSNVKIIEKNAIGENSHTEGESTIAYGKNSHVQGKFNIADTEKKYAHILGNGTSTYKRSNAHTVDWDGNAWYSGNMTLGANNLSVICYELSNENIGIENAISGLFYDITEQDFLLTIK